MNDLLEIARWLKTLSPEQMIELSKQVSQLKSFDAVIEHLERMRQLENKTLQ